MTADEEDLLLLILSRDSMIAYSKEFAKHIAILSSILTVCVALCVVLSLVIGNLPTTIVIAVITALVGLEWLCNLVLSISVWINTAKSVKFVKSRVKDIG